MIQKSYKKNNLGNLYLVPTPIGNLSDITNRAIEVLSKVDKIYAEDTRESKKLLNSLKISNKIESCHKYSETKRKEKIVNELKTGKNLAYISDRGTPLISDPGQIIADYVIKKSLNVIALPGPSAFLPALNMSGLSNDKFLFYGFLSSKQKERIEELKKLYTFPHTIIFYEAPHRINLTLIDMKNIFGNRKVSVSREISKLHEEIFRGTLLQAIEYSENIKGEIVIVVEGLKVNISNIDYVLEVKKLIKKGYKPSNAIREIATIYGISKNKLYNECEDIL